MARNGTVIGGGPGGGIPHPSAPSLPPQKLIAAVDGSVKVTVLCSSGSSACAGTVALTVTKLGKAYLASTKARPRERVIVIASARLTITAGHRHTFKLRLTKFGRSLLRSHSHGLPATLRVIERSKNITIKRLKLNTAPSRRHR